MNPSLQSPRHEFLSIASQYAGQLLHLHSDPDKMPKSKRARVVHLSKTKKKGKELTLRLHASVQECVPNYPYIYVFRVDNMRNTYLKDVRSQLKDSR